MTSFLYGEAQGRRRGFEQSNWTEERIAELKRLWDDKVSCSRIAAALGGGATRNSVIGKAHRLNLPPRSSVPTVGSNRPESAWTVETTARLLEFASDGMSATEISALTGISRNSIVGKAGRMGVKLKTTFVPRQHARRPSIARPSEPAELVLSADERAADNAARDLAIPAEQRRTLVELTGHTCRWPVGDPGTPEFFFCGAEPDGGPYCPRHRSIATVKPREPMSAAEREERLRAIQRGQNAATAWGGA